MARKRKPRRIHQEPIVRRVARILESGRSSKFEFQGACHTGLRTRFCLSGTTWPESDKIAGLIVTLALARIGASRPSWQQGQPEADDREFWFCRVCGGRIQDEGRWRWCSDECKAVGIQRATEARLRADAQAARAAFWAARSKGDEPERDCAHCGEPFRIKIEGPRRALQRYCSRECYLAVRTVNRARQCAGCGQQFSYVTKRQRYCSPTCGKRHALPAVQRGCIQCGAIFTDRSRSGRRQFCGDACGKRYRRQPAFRCEAA